MSRRRPEALDIVKLYAQGSYVEWNAHLTKCYRNHDLKQLAETRRRLQAGMALAAKKKLNSDDIVMLFIRMQRSIEDTMRKIIREKIPNPCDDPLKAVNHLEHRSAKRMRDALLEKYLKDTSY